MDTLTELQDRIQLHPSDHVFARQMQERIEQGENVRVWLYGFNYQVFAVRARRGNLQAATCDGWLLASQMSFADTRLTAECWQS
jgi:hypothetical protein